MNILDSSAWLEYIKNPAKVPHFAEIAENIEELLVPSIILYEVFKAISRQAGKEVAIEVLGHMQMAKIIGIHANDALNAAWLSEEHKLPTADALIYSIAHQTGASLWTQDSDFKGLPFVNYFNKP